MDIFNAPSYWHRNCLLIGFWKQKYTEQKTVEKLNKQTDIDCYGPWPISNDCSCTPCFSFDTAFKGTQAWDIFAFFASIEPLWCRGKDVSDRFFVLKKSRVPGLWDHKDLVSEKTWKQYFMLRRIRLHLRSKAGGLEVYLSSSNLSFSPSKLGEFRIE